MHNMNVVFLGGGWGLKEKIFMPSFFYCCRVNMKFKKCLVECLAFKTIKVLNI